jgi:hypothetical protein
MIGVVSKAMKVAEGQPLFCVEQPRGVLKRDISSWRVSSTMIIDKSAHHLLVVYLNSGYKH